MCRKGKCTEIENDFQDIAIFKRVLAIRTSNRKACFSFKAVFSHFCLAFISVNSVLLRVCVKYSPYLRENVRVFFQFIYFIIIFISFVCFSYCYILAISTFLHFYAAKHKLRHNSMYSMYMKYKGSRSFSYFDTFIMILFASLWGEQTYKKCQKWLYKGRNYFWQYTYLEEIRVYSKHKTLCINTCWDRYGNRRVFYELNNMMNYINGTFTIYILYDAITTVILRICNSKLLFFHISKPNDIMLH